ncbi:C45 family autoproteolytic acyltransferase/hydolase [Haliangium sp.]|uniref:C45 family autoproteolytic acyltransferase/hydolase n=1 Tax=Haliangium sp. TaxID=2663208 RepID=UPI003D0D31F5
MRVLALEPGRTPREWGRAHGESFRGEIQSLAELRGYLTMTVGGFPDLDTVREIAAAHVPVLADYDRDLHDELCGVAEGADLSPADVVVVNHYTDLRDIYKSRAGAADAAPGQADGDSAGGCSIVWARTPAGPILAQTWDMHATAIPYVMMMHVPAGPAGPETWLFTLTGCLGMTGLNRHGLGVAINNLHSTDARVGLVWPALVRRALRESSAAAARDLVLTGPLGSGHHYLVADADAAWGIETSGEHRLVMFEAAPAGGAARPDPGAHYIHTNHCLDPKVAAASRVPPASTTYDRYGHLEASLARAPVADVHDAWRRLGDHTGYPRSVCTNMATPQNPHGAATCGAVAMELGSPRVWAEGGFVHNVEPVPFAFEACS